MKKWGIAVSIVALVGNAGMTVAQESRAVQDLKAFMAKFEEGDALFNQKKYGEAASTLASANDLYQRALRRDSNSGGTDFFIKTGQMPALRYYGYGFGPNASLSEKLDGTIAGTAAGFHRAQGDMWMDAAILAGHDRIPQAAFSDPELVDMSEEQLNSHMHTVCSPISHFQLPVPDDEWRSVTLQSRRAVLMLEYALQKYPEWRTGNRSWGRFKGELTHSGADALDEIKAKLAEAEPEYAKIAADAKKAAPKYATDLIGYRIEDLDKAIAGVKQNGWIQWNLARSIFIDKDYVSVLRKAIAKLYAEEGKTMPSDVMKPVDDKVAELRRTMEQSVSRWKFPGGKPKNAPIEAKAGGSVKSRIPGATILKTALDSGQWIITKNDLDIPRYRSMGVLVLAKVPGQKNPWLIFTYLRQSYSGGGTYNAGGTVQDPSDVRIQAG